MFGYKSPSILIAEIEMIRAGHDCAVLIVEGYDDERLWLRFRASECELVVGEGKTNVVMCIKELDARAYTGVLGLVDDDFDHVLRITRDSSNLVSTDASDIECLLCRSCALESVLFEHGEQSRIAEFEERTSTTIRCALLALAVVFGRLRWAEKYFGFEIHWKDVGGMQRFVSQDRWELDEVELIDVTSRVSGLDPQWLTSKVRGLPSGADPWFIARGHDLVELLRLGLRGALGQVKATVGAEDVSSWLRLGFTTAALEATGLAGKIRTWEGRNAPYAILAT